MTVQFGHITKPPMVAKRRINAIGLNEPITQIYPLDPNGVAVCPSGFDCVRCARSAQDDNQTFVFCLRYNGNNGRFVFLRYDCTGYAYLSLRGATRVVILERSEESRAQAKPVS